MGSGLLCLDWNWACWPHHVFFLWLSNDWFLFLHLHGVLHHLRLFATLYSEASILCFGLPELQCIPYCSSFLATLPLYPQLHMLLLLQLGLSLEEFIIGPGTWLCRLYVCHCKDKGGRQEMRQRIPASPVLVFQWEWTNSLTSAMLNAHFCWSPRNTVYPVKTSPAPSLLRLTVIKLPTFSHDANDPLRKHWHLSLAMPPILNLMSFRLIYSINSLLECFFNFLHQVWFNSVKTRACQIFIFSAWAFSSLLAVRILNQLDRPQLACYPFCKMLISCWHWVA